MEFTIESGTKVKGADGQRYSVSEELTAKGEFVEQSNSTQKTYLLKAVCPKCKRIIRVTNKNWKNTEVRIAITCMHVNGEAFNFELDETPGE